MLKVERLATPEEAERILVDVWTMRSEGPMTHKETITLAEQCRRHPEMKPWVHEYLTLGTHSFDA